MRIAPSIANWVCYVGVLVLCLSRTSILHGAEVVNEPPRTGDLHYADFVAAAENADETIIWEGLPHPFDDSLRRSELQTKPNFRIGDQSFYTLALKLTNEQKTAVSDAFVKHIENFRVWSGFKLCGGFHADYAVEWRYQGAILAQALICFSCHEVQFRAGDRIEQVDQSDDGFQRFRLLFLPLQQQRPVAGSGSAKIPAPPNEKPGNPKLEVMTPDKVSIAPPPIDFVRPLSAPSGSKPK